MALRGAPRACFGELGLTGELRWVGHPERRLAEAARHGLGGRDRAARERRAARARRATLREALAPRAAALAGRSERASRGPRLAA